MFVSYATYNAMGLSLLARAIHDLFYTGKPWSFAEEWSMHRAADCWRDRTGSYPTVGVIAFYVEG